LARHPCPFRGSASAALDGQSAAAHTVPAVDDHSGGVLQVLGVRAPVQGRLSDVHGLIVRHRALNRVVADALERER
jgi:hypothetical protein